MAFKEELQVGVPTSIAQNSIFAMPPVICHVTSAAAIEVGNDAASTTAWVLLTTSTTGAFVSSAFVRCTTATTTICCKKF